MADLYEIKSQTTSATAGKVITENIEVALGGMIMSGIIQNTAGVSVSYAPVLLIGDGTTIIARTLRNKKKITFHFTSYLDYLSALSNRLHMTNMRTLDALKIIQISS